MIVRIIEIIQELDLRTPLRGSKSSPAAGQRDRRVERHGLAEEIALAECAAHLGQQIRFFYLLDPFCDNGDL